LELEQRLDDITACLTELQLFKILHTEALRQIRQHINVPYCDQIAHLFSKDIFESLVVQLCHLYDYLRSTCSPDSPPVSPISLTAETCASRKTQAWWVHADNSTGLMMHLLKYLSLTTRDDTQDSISNKVTSIVLDNPCQADYSKIVKVQWSNAGQELRLKAMDSENRIRSLKTKQKYLEKWINMEWSLSDLVKKLRAQGHDTKSVESNASYIQHLIDTGSIPGKQFIYPKQYGAVPCCYNISPSASDSVRSCHFPNFFLPLHKDHYR
jgi:phosphoglycerate-specific signal transduction histidine kinase